MIRTGHGLRQLPGREYLVNSFDRSRGPLDRRHAHSERAAAAGQLDADPAEADNADRRTEEFPGIGDPRPFPGALLLRMTIKLSRRHEHEGQRVLGKRDAHRPGRIGEHKSRFGFQSNSLVGVVAGAPAEVVLNGRSQQRRNGCPANQDGCLPNLRLNLPDIRRLGHPDEIRPAPAGFLQPRDMRFGQNIRTRHHQRLLVGVFETHGRQVQGSIEAGTESCHADWTGNSPRKA